MAGMRAAQASRGSAGAGCCSAGGTRKHVRLEHLAAQLEHLAVQLPVRHTHVNLLNSNQERRQWPWQNPEQTERSAQALMLTKARHCARPRHSQEPLLPQSQSTAAKGARRGTAAPDHAPGACTGRGVASGTTKRAAGGSPRVVHRESHAKNLGTAEFVFFHVLSQVRFG